MHKELLLYLVKKMMILTEMVALSFDSICSSTCNNNESFVEGGNTEALEKSCAKRSKRNGVPFIIRCI